MAAKKFWLEEGNIVIAILISVIALCRYLLSEEASGWLGGRDGKEKKREVWLMTQFALVYR